METQPLPQGSYFDQEGMLRGKDRNLLPDGIYLDEEGNPFIYEGNFAKNGFLEETS